MALWSRLLIQNIFWVAAVNGDKHKKSLNKNANFIYATKEGGVHSAAVGWGTALQAGRSRIRFPLGSLT